MSIFYIFYNFHYHYQGQGNRLVGSNILGVFLATESPCTFLDVRSRQGLQASDIFRKQSWVFNYSINLIKRLCHLANELQGLQDHRNWFINCVCYSNYFWYNFHKFGLHFYIT